MRNFLKYKDNFYFFTETENNAYTDIETLHFYKMDSVGNSDKIIVPKDLRNVYRDLFIKNDSIFAIEYWNKNTFFLDHSKKEFLKTKQAEDVIFENESYIIYSADFGEFGGYTWLKEKEIQKEFGIQIYFENVSYFNNKFILGNGNCIVEIIDPKKLKNALVKYNNFNIEQEKNSEITGQIIDAKFNSKDFKILFQEKDYSKPEIILHSSFVLNNSLYFLYTNNNIAKIGEFINGGFKEVYKFSKDIRIIKYHFDYRKQSNNIVIAQFQTPNQYLNGIIEIVGNKIQINYIENLNKTPILSEEESINWFKKCFSYYSENIKNLNYSNIADFEKMINSFPILLGKGLNTYRSKEENNFVLTKEYYFSVENDKVKHFTFFWDYRNLEIIIFDDTSKTNQKANIILKFLTEKFGKPSKYEKFNDNKYSYDWNLPNQNISLFVSNTRVAVDLENN